MNKLTQFAIFALMTAGLTGPVTVNAAPSNSLPTPIVAGAYDAFGKVCERSDAAATKTANSAVCSEKSTGDPVSGPDGVIMQVVNIIAIIAGAAAVIMIVISGIKFVTSNGDSNGVSSAKNTLIQVFIGLAIIILARYIILFIVSRI